MKLTAEYIRKDFELYFSVFHFLSGNKRWFCRFWINNDYFESYGDTKWEAYRKALKNRNQALCLY